MVGATAATSQPHVEAHLLAVAADRLEGDRPEEDESLHRRREKGCGELLRTSATRKQQQHHHQHLHLPHHKDQQHQVPHRPRVVLSVVETPGGHDELLDDPPQLPRASSRRHPPRLHASSNGKKRGRASSAPSLRPFDSPPPKYGATPQQPSSQAHTHWFLPAALSLEDLQRVAGCDRSAAAYTATSGNNHKPNHHYRRRSRSSTSPESPTRPLLHARSQSRSSTRQVKEDGDNREPRPFNGNEDGDDDDVSVASSTAYFEPSDLSPSNWMQAIDAPTFAFGLVALSAAIAHPLFFVAGALAALGTAQAAGAGYDYFNDRPISLVCWRPNLQHAVVGEDDDYDEESKGENTKGDYTTASDSKKPSQQRHPLSHATTGVHPPSSLPAPSAPQPLSPHNLIPDTPTLEQPNHAQLEHWVAQHYPSFDHPLVRDEAFLGLSALEVFAVFFDDHAPYNFVEFQKKRGDVNIVYQPWQPLPDPPVPFQSPFMTAAKDSSSDASSHSTVSARLPSPPLLHKQRIVTFRAKTHSLLGPPYASTTKVQRFIVFSKKLAVIDTETTLADIPFGDRFKVYERWIVRADKEPPPSGSSAGGGATATAPSTYNARLSASCQVVFDPTQPCPFEGHIRTKTKSTVNEVATAWCSMAQQALKLAHKAKQERLRQELQSTYHPKTCHPNEDDAPDDRTTKPLDPPIEAIEVEHDGDLGIVTLRRSESEPLHEAPAGRSRSASQHHPYQHQQLLSLQGFRRSLSHLAKRGGGGGSGVNSGGNNRDVRSHSPPESAAAERRPRKATTLW